MAYSTSNPPLLQVQSVASTSGRRWLYVSADAANTVRANGYITNGGALGMKVGDIVEVRDTATPLTTDHLVLTVSSTFPGAVDLGDQTTVGLNTNT